MDGHAFHDPLDAEIASLLQTKTDQWSPAGNFGRATSQRAVDLLIVAGLLEARVALTAVAEGNDRKELRLLARVTGNYPRPLYRAMFRQVPSAWTKRGALRRNVTIVSDGIQELRLTSAGVSQKPMMTADEVSSAGPFVRRLAEFVQRGKLVGTAKIESAELVRVKPDRMSADEANVKAREYLRKRPDAKARALAEHIGCSIGLIAKLPAWRAIHDRRCGRTPRPQVMSLTSAMENRIETHDATLEWLIQEQEADARSDPSPLEPDPADRPPQRPRQYKRL